MLVMMIAFCARNEDASLLKNLEQAFGRCIPSKEDIKREVGTAASIVSAAHIPHMNVLVLHSWPLFLPLFYMLTSSLGIMTSA